MSQQAAMTMAGMGGPVGPIGGATPNAMNNNNIDTDPSEYIKRLNTYIYDYFVRNQHYDCARTMLAKNLPLGVHQKLSPNQRQVNGIDDMDTDLKDPDRPKDLPLPDLPATGGHFLEDWWVQFWEVFNSRRSGSGKPATLAYLTTQRQAQKARNGMMGGGVDAMQRNFSMMNGGVTPGDLKKTAMQNAGNMNTMQAQMAARARAQGAHPNMQGNAMERQGSQMDARSGSPGSGGAPSPKRARVDNNMPQMGQRPGQPGQMPSSQSLEMYNASMQAQMKHGLNQAQESSNLNKGMPPATAASLAAMQAAAAQGSPMPQGAMDMAEFQNNAMVRANMMQNAAQGQGPNGGGNPNGSHALQDYQMQLMLLEQQNKRRLLMARQEQDGIANHSGVPVANEQGSPNPVQFDQNSVPHQLRGQMMVGPNGQVMQRPNPQQLSQQEMALFQRQAGMMAGNFPQGMPPNMMPGQPGQTAPNMTPRQGNNQMPPPPAPQQNAAGNTNPSSPAPPAAPPTPNQTAKSKPANKKETKASKAANKKNSNNTTAATPASEAEQPPTPTPQTPMTPMPGKNFNANQNAAMANGGLGANGTQVNGQQQPGQAPGVMSSGQTDLGGFGMDGSDQFMLPDFSIDAGGTDVLENFDFDAFLNNDGADGLANFADFSNFDAVGDVTAADALGQ